MEIEAPGVKQIHSVSRQPSRLKAVTSGCYFGRKLPMNASCTSEGASRRVQSWQANLIRMKRALMHRVLFNAESPRKSPDCTWKTSAVRRRGVQPFLSPIFFSFTATCLTIGDIRAGLDPLVFFLCSLTRQHGYQLRHAKFKWSRPARENRRQGTFQ